MGRGAGLLALLLIAGPPARLPAQVAANRASLYLHPTDVRDARAVWVNPAGLAVLYHAAVYLDLTVRNPGDAGRLEQVAAGFSSRGLGFSYQRDNFAGGPVAHTYRLGVAGAASGLAAGAAVAYYRGEATATGWDLGVVYAARPSVTVGGVLANIGRPGVRGVDLPFTAVPAVTVAPVGPSLALSVHARLTSDSVLGYAFGARWTSRGRLPVALLARLDTDGGMRRAAFAFGVSVGLDETVGAVVTASGDLRAVDAASLYGVVFRSLGR